MGLFLGIAAILAAGIYTWQVHWASSIPDLPVLRILAYDSMTGMSGIGPQLAKEFEKNCHCKVEMWSGGDGGDLLAQMKLRAGGPPVDLVVGLDGLDLARAAKEWSWRKQPEGVNDFFIPIDRSPMGFIYREGEINPPKDWSDLLSPRFAKQISLPDPRTSTAGKQFLFALFNALEGKGVKEYLHKLAPNVRAVAASWSGSYGLFQKGEAKLTYSYLTSLIYHQREEKDLRYRFADFSSGHATQTEYMALSDRCGSCELAEQFIIFFLRPEGERLILKKNFMFPAKMWGIEEEKEYLQLPKVKDQAGNRMSEFQAQESQLLHDWVETMP